MRNVKVLMDWCSIGRLEFYFGGDLHYKNLQTSVLETKVIMVKAGRCLPIMDPTSTIMSQLLQRLRKTIFLLILMFIINYLDFSS